MVDETYLLGFRDLIAAVFILMNDKGTQIKWNLRHQDGFRNDDRRVGALRMPHAKLIKHVSVQGRKIGNDDIRSVDPFVHQRIDTAGQIGVNGSKCIDIHPIKSRPDELFIRLVQVEYAAGCVVCFQSEAGYDKTSHLFSGAAVGCNLALFRHDSLSKKES